MTLDENKKLYTKYKWEFLRRNPSYVKEYDELQNTIEEEYGDPGWTPPTGEPTHKETAFCVKWGISRAIPPEQSYEDITTYKGEKRISIDKKFFIDLEERAFRDLFLPAEFFGKPPVRTTGGWEYDYDGDFIHSFVSNKVAETGVLTIEIDLNYSKKKLMDELKSLVDEWKSLYEKAYKEWLSEQFHNKDYNYAFPVEKEKHLQRLAKEIQRKKQKKGFESFYKQKVRERQKQYKTKYHFDNFDISEGLGSQREKRAFME